MNTSWLSLIPCNKPLWFRDGMEKDEIETLPKENGWKMKRIFG
jgi:hypothetical protein